MKDVHALFKLKLGTQSTYLTCALRPCDRCLLVFSVRQTIPSLRGDVYGSESYSFGPNDVAGNFNEIFTHILVYNFLREVFRIVCHYQERYTGAQTSQAADTEPPKLFIATRVLANLITERYRNNTKFSR